MNHGTVKFIPLRNKCEFAKEEEPQTEDVKNNKVFLYSIRQKKSELLLLDPNIYLYSLQMLL